MSRLDSGIFRVIRDYGPSYVCSYTRPGKITSNISADISRIDSAAQWFHAVILQSILIIGNLLIEI